MKWWLTIVGALLMIVVSLIVFIPFCLRDYGRPPHEIAAIRSLQTLNDANRKYALSHQRSFAASLTDFAGLIDSQLSKGEKSGYRFRYVNSSVINAYEIVAEPIDPDKEANRYFFTDQTGVVRYGTGSVTAQSAPL